METLGDRLRVYRTKAGLTQDKLGELSGSNQACIQKIENGRSENPRCLRDISKVLGVRPGWLHYGEGEADN